MTRGEVGGLIAAVGTVLSATFGLVGFVLKVSDAATANAKQTKMIDASVERYFARKNM